MSAQVLRWSTDDILPAHRAEAYVELFGKGVMNIEVSELETEDFSAEVKMSQLGPIGIGTVGGSQHRSSRTASQIARSAEHAYNLVVGLSGTFQWSDHDTRL